MAEIAYKPFAGVHSKKLEMARNTELEGKINESLVEYNGAIRELEIELFRESELSDTRHDELLGKLYLARGKIAELTNVNPLVEFERCLDLYATILEKKPSGIDDNIKSGYAVQAVCDVQTLVLKYSGKNVKSRNNIDSKYAEIIQNMPSEIVEALKPGNFGYFDMYHKYSVQDVSFAKTKDYSVVVAKWEEHSWSDRGGGIGWENWLSVYFAKQNGKELWKFGTDKIQTRDHSNERNDRKDLWSYNLVGIETYKDNKIVVYWKDEKGSKGPTYNFNLDMKLQEIQNSRDRK